MKKLIALVMAIIAVLATSVPAYAASVTTGVTVLSGNGFPPTVKAEWETTSNITLDAESGDPGHLVPGTQVAPNIGWQAETNVWFWAVVTDTAGVANISHVYADVYYPVSGPVDPGPNGSLKFEVELIYSATDTGAKDAFDSAYAAGLVALGDGFTQAEIDEELVQQSARLYVGFFHFDNCQLAGDYVVTTNAVNRQNVRSILSNTLQWLPLTAAEWDFNNVDYGIVAIGVHKQIDGNYIWDTNPGTNQATIRNIGNTYFNMTIKQDDMGLGKTNINGINVWNIHYDARLGDSDTGRFGNDGMVNFDPVVTKGGNLADTFATRVPEVLKVCASEKVDFSIKVDKDSIQGADHSYTGNMILGVVISPGPPTNPL